MVSEIKCHMRAKELLTLFKDYGPLSFRALSQMVQPPMKATRLHDSLSRLGRRGLVKKRFERVFSGRGVFYQVVQDSTKRTRTAKLLACSPDDLLQPHFRYRELLHTESCALWAHKLRKLYPTAIVVRDYEFSKSSHAQEAMLTDGADYDLTPDLIMTLPKTDSKERVVLAVEIESTTKSAERLRIKLKKYASKTVVDGVIYLCEPDGLKDTIASLYRGQVLQNADRINHYGNYFFMFLTSPVPYREEAPVLVNSEFKVVPLTRWIEFLQTRESNFRRDAHLEKSGVNS